ncbi:UNVERIFIED_CONTAM: E3 ubiquitin-protein ligase HOS1 [Sesamum radiatum]|uniref:E3 ubiquitin-protein ligase HOS1 n=1 Tax=Sesamum radiatum TaxID=300843 RepID=A0AAW2L2Q2_SESRA
MVGRKFDEPTASSSQKALVRLASIDPIELCNEAKVERCRATRDLRSCGRCVQRVLISCGHAALCDECSQRCDSCPICRIALPKGANELPLRLYYECIEAGLISTRCDDRLQDKEDAENQVIADVQRLYSLFDVALENNLRFYFSNACGPEPSSGEYSEDKAVICYFSIKIIPGDTQMLAIAGKTSLCLCKLLTKIFCILQHLDIMMWCIRHQFLEKVRSRYSDFALWRSSFRERKSAAIKRAWPDPVSRILESSDQSVSSLFIEDALSNLDTEQEYAEKDEGELSIASLLTGGGDLFFRSKLHGMPGCYPFENLRAAVDLLFLRGNSDLVVAKQAIRYRYVDAYQVDSKLLTLEEDFIAKIRNDEIAYKMRSMSHWRKGLVGQSVDLLPDVLQQQLKTGTLPEEVVFTGNENIPAKPDSPKVQEPVLGKLLFRAPQVQWEGNGFLHPQL